MTRPSSNAAAARKHDGSIFEVLERIPAPAAYSVEKGDDWIFLTSKTGKSSSVLQGWKLHIAARPSSLKATLDAALPVLFDENCDFKIVASEALLQMINEGGHGPGGVGKAITVYLPQNRIRSIACRLADALRGFEAPRIPSDRQVIPDAPVYYRFGPFAPDMRYDNNGSVDIVVRAPDGRIVSGTARDRYVAPDWLEDPFHDGGDEGRRLPRKNGAPVIGDHYGITSVISRSYRGASYRAIDERTGQSVVIKEALAFTNESNAGDARTYLRNERAILEVLEGVERVPRVVDHFVYGSDEYLAVTELGKTDLMCDVVDEGVFSLGDGGRSLLKLGQSLLALLDAIHGRGVIFRDLAPKNIVRMADGGWGLVDFELSRADGGQLFGWSPGYAPGKQRSNAKATPADDYYSLGATLVYALTGLDPVIIDEDPDVNTARTLECLVSICGKGSRAFKLLSRLLAADEIVRTSAAAELRNLASLRQNTRRAPGGNDPPLRIILRNKLADLVRDVDRLVQDAPSSAVPPPIAAQSGIAGVLAELALHPECEPQTRALAELTSRVGTILEAPPGLMFGRMGVALALQSASRRTGDSDFFAAALELLPSLEIVEAECQVDVSHGLAGLGLGYLGFAAAGRPSDDVLPLAGACAERLLSDQQLIEDQLALLPTGKPAHAISVADGYAHGRAGIIHFLLAYGAASADGQSLRRARQMLDALVEKSFVLSRRANSNQARPMALSWCQGLSGIAAVMLRGGHVFQEQRYRDAARTAADACIRLAPRVPLVTQCCGLAGTGELLLDLYRMEREESDYRRALDIFKIMLTRAGGSREKPRFPSSMLGVEAPGWGDGTTGVISFVRRLLDPDSRRLWLVEPVVPAAVSRSCERDSRFAM